jgi:hypothetical protein
MLRAFVTQIGPPDMLTRCRALLLTAQKTANLHGDMPKLSPFLKDFLPDAKFSAEWRHRPAHCMAFRRAGLPALL